MNLRLRSLSVRLEEWGDNKGKYTGTVSFVGQTGSMDIVLGSELSEQCLRLCGDALVAHAKETAQNMTTAVIENQTPLIGE